MHFSNLVLGLSACMIPASLAIKQITPPKFFVLQAESNSLTRNGTYDGYYIYQKQVSNTAAVVAPAPQEIPAEFYQLTSPNTTDNLTTYSLLLASGPGRKGYVTPDLRYQAFWQSLYLTFAKSPVPTAQQNVFFVGGSQSEMYLQMNPRLIFDQADGSIVSEGFQGFLVCYWSQELPQLFYATSYGYKSTSVLPSDCDYYNVRVIPLTK